MKKLIQFLLPAFILCSCLTDRSVNIMDYPEVVDVQELADNYILFVDTSGKHEDFKLSRYFDGSLELEYEYDLIETTEFDPLYYSISISQEKNSMDARQSYNIQRNVMSLIKSVPDQDLIEIDTLDIQVDDYYYALHTYEGSPIGEQFVMRDGNSVFYLAISGMYTDDCSLILDLIMPRLENLADIELDR